MDSLFGLSTTTIMWVLVALFAVCAGSVAAIWASNRTMFRVGLRNIPRRGTQSVLVVVGLMLSTLIITAAFSTGDSLDYSITSATYDGLQRNDLFLNFDGSEGRARVASETYLDGQIVPALETAFADDPDIAGFLPYVFEPAPVLNPRTRLAESSVIVAGVDTARLEQLGGLRLVDGGRADLANLASDEVLVSETAADRLDARPGDTLTLYARAAEFQVRVAGVVEDEVANGGVTGAGGLDDAGGIAMPLASAQRIFDLPRQVNAVAVALEGGVRGSIGRSEAAAGRLESFLQSDEGKAALGLGDLTVEVDQTKREGVERAEQAGNLFTTFFLVLGLFSIAAGVMLIFMIFVMLAAERKTEMGIARAVGTKRINLVQAFISEGMAYNLLAGIVGAALGVGAAAVLVVGGASRVFGDEGFSLSTHVTPRTLTISFCLGAVLTFVTVAISSFRVSRLNVVAAIRGTEDVSRREGRRRTSWRWVALGLPALVVPPLGLWLLLRRGFGLPNAWVWGPLGALSGVAAILFAGPASSYFLFALGMSLLPLALAALARYYHAPSRLTWTLVGVYLLMFWLVPLPYDELLLGKELNGDIEMFVLSGIMIVIGFTLTIVFNARLLTMLFRGADGAGRAYAAPVLLAIGALGSAVAALALGDGGDGLGQLLYLPAGLLALAAALATAAARFPRFGPALKMGVAYPLANRFRTGMTIAMFSLIVFSLVTMSTMNANFIALFAGDEARGGWDLVATTSATNPVDDPDGAGTFGLAGALRAEGSFDTSQITEVARATASEGARQVRQTGQGEAWVAYPVRAGDDAFFAQAEMSLAMRASGYDSDRAVFDAVGSQPGLAIIDALPVVGGGFGPGSDFTVTGIASDEEEFEPFQVEVRDPVTGRSATLTVIGVLSEQIPAEVMSGLYTNEESYAHVFGAPDYRVSYLRLSPGTDGEQAAKGIKAALLTKGVEAFSIEELIDDQQAQARGFSRIFQAFLALGLLVGMAALGVIAFRAVVERRQQIGMLRAIGYQRGTVALTFLLESSFIALMGIFSGVAGAVVLSRNLLTSEAIAGTAQFDFFIPWVEVTAFVLLAYGCALLLTWWPSRGAARVPIAEALRYE